MGGKMKHVIEFDEKCKSCDGTGLYVGMAENDGAAVVCHACKGTGKCHVKFEYEDFTGRGKRIGIKRVYETNVGIGIGTDNGTYELSDFGGVDYKDWLAGKPFPPKSEMRRFTCPAWWYQLVDYDKKPNWDECRSNLGYSFSRCPYFSTREKCWERWDKENVKIQQ